MFIRTTSTKLSSASFIALRRSLLSANNARIRDTRQCRAFTSSSAKLIQMKDFTYDLKIESIAKYPAEPRGSSRLLRVDRTGTISHYDNFAENFLSVAGGAHVVFNESKVANGRVQVVKENCTQSLEMMILDLGNIVDREPNGLRLTVMLRDENVCHGDIFRDEGSKGAQFRVVDVIGPWIEDEHSNGNGTECVVECLTSSQNSLGTTTTLTDMLDQIGTVPIPPYLNRDSEASDEASYNNVFAAGMGSVAAPTAGLHFTDDLLKQIGKENTSFLSLHVGAGTFKPVVAEDARDHQMHGENFAVNVGEILRIIDVMKSKKKMIVVGTTSSRTLESLYWCGVKSLIKGNKNSGSEDIMLLGQHEWRDLKYAASTITAVEAFQAIVEGKKSKDTVFGRTSLMIVPNAYDFKVVDNLITNFHAPDSTLMLLVSAFLGGGQKVTQVYEEAQSMGYRFLSYGDVCYFSKPNKV